MELKDVRANAALTLENDPNFFGYVVGVLELREPGPTQVLMAVVTPGATGIRAGAHRPLPLAQLKPAPFGRAK